MALTQEIEPKPTPTLHIDVQLTPLYSDDLTLLFKWINDREQVHYNASYKPVSQKQHLAWFDSIQQRKDMYIFGIRSITSDKLIGSCQLKNLDLTYRSAELQIRIGDVQERDKGYGKQAISKLLQFGFDDLNLNRIYLYVFEDNERAYTVYKKTGFIDEGLLREAAYINGCYKNIRILGILKHEYEAQKVN